MKWIIFKFFIKQLLEIRKFYYPGKLVSYPKHNLNPTQVYQNGTNFDKNLKNSLLKSLNGLKLKKNSKIASMGTCFAEEISKFLKYEKNLGNYIQLEENIWESSVDWGRVYTIQNIKQIIEYSTNKKTVIHIEEDKGVFFDPLREQTVKRSNSKEGMLSKILTHRKLSRSVLEQVDVLVITIGQNECWEDNEKKIYWGVMPPSSIKTKNIKRFTVKEANVQENIKDLRFIVKSILKINKSIQFLFTVSPVPSEATFLSDDVVTQSFAGKCILRSSVHELMKENNKSIFYFPSFEIALAKNQETFRFDNRHIKFSKVTEILSFLKK